MKIFLWLILFLGLISRVEADPVEEIWTYFNPDVPGSYNTFIWYDRYAVRFEPSDFGVPSDISWDWNIEGIWSSSGMYGPVRVALCEDDTINPPGCLDCEYSPGDTISLIEYIAPFGDLEDTVFFETEVRREDDHPLWIYFDYEAEGIIFANSGTQPPVGRNISRIKGGGERIWWSDDDDWAVGLLVRWEPPVGIDPVDKPTIPKSFTLNQNFPNPFNPLTTISFTLERESPVKLSLYNLRGKLLEVLVDKPLSQGNHQVIWKGSGNSGHYFYELRAGNEVARKKLTLLK